MSEQKITDIINSLTPDECHLLSTVLHKKLHTSSVDDMDPAEYSYFPIKYEKLEGLYHTLVNTFWAPGEVSFEKDRDIYERLPIVVRDFVDSILFLFAQVDSIVVENIVENFTEQTSQLKEARLFYGIQEANENVHMETYARNIRAVLTDEKKFATAFNAIREVPAIRRIAEWMKRWMDVTIPITESGIAFVCVEGILFQSAFAAIYWLNRRPEYTMPGMTQANEWIARDEGVHTKFFIELYHIITENSESLKRGNITQEYFDSLKDVLKYEKLPEARVIEIVTSHIDEVAIPFINDALRIDRIDMNVEDMISYIKCIADNILEGLGYNRYYKAKNPFDWMIMISFPNRSNFHERKVTEYARISTEKPLTFERYDGW